MSTQNYVADTLELPQQIPLFRYNVNFNGLKKLLEQLNIQTNTNSQSIKKINEQMKGKYMVEQFKAHEKVLNNSINFGVNVQKYIDQQENKFMQIKIDTKDQKTNTEEFANKMGKLNEIVDYLLMKTLENQERIQYDDSKNEKLINDSFKRLEDRLQASIQSFGKTINNYFNEANKKSSSIQSDFNMLKVTQDSKIKQLQDGMNNKVSSNMLQSTLEGFKHKILKQMGAQIDSDQMKRLAAIEEYKNQLKQLQKNLDLQNKVTKQKVSQLDQKVKASLATKAFQMQKHKIFEKLSEMKNKTDQLSRKNNQFVQFRKNYLTQKQKMKQEIIGIQDQLKKLNSQQSSFKKMQNVSDILNKLDPHLICEIGNEVKLHEKQIGRLEKKIMGLQTEGRDTKGINAMPQVNSGENSELMQKIIKEYMSNMDFQGRIKKAEKDVYQVSRKTDVFHDLQKKIYNLSKDLDVGAIMKQLKRKCDQQNTKKQLKIVDSKIQNLFDYFKTIRKQLQILYKRTALSSIKDNPDNPSLTSKKLIGANCLSCTTSTVKRRTYSRQKLDYSFDQGHDYLKSTNYQKFK